MENERFARMQETTGIHLAMEVEETMQRLQDFPDTPEAMDYFFDFFQKLFGKNHRLPEKRKIIGTMCLQVPDELILAAGAVPYRMCSGAYAYDQIGAEFMPAKSCPLVKATTGMFHVKKQRWPQELDALVIPTTCDQKKKSCEILKDMGYPVFPLEMPSTKESEASRSYWQESVKQFTLDLQKITGNKITSQKLREAIDLKSKGARLFRKLHELRRSTPPLIFGKDILLVTNAYYLDDTDNWCVATESLLLELEKRKAAAFHVGQKQAPRLLLTGSPPIFPNLKVPILVEQAGGVIVADEVCSSNRLLYDAVAFDEENLNDMVPAVADRYLKPCTCPCLTPNTDRQRKVLAMADSHKVEGVVYQSFSGCMPYEMEQKQISTALAEAGIPMLYLETDYSPEDMGQLSTRVEAFIESIIARRRKAA